MAFTGQLGIASSRPGNIELGVAGGGAAPASTQKLYAPEIYAGPPMRGSPWLQRLPIDPPVPPTSVFIPTQPPGVSMGMTEIYAGPPLRGAPWLNRLPIEPTVPPTPLPPPTGQPTYVYEITGGPPMRGAPFTQHLPFDPPPPPLSAYQATQPPGVQIWSQEVNAGPPMRGAPFAQRLPIDPLISIAPILKPASGPPQPELSTGPPMVGAPWVQWVPITSVVSQPVPVVGSVGNPAPVPEVRFGPAMSGAPWAALVVATPPPLPVIFPPAVVGVPPPPNLVPSPPVPLPTAGPYKPLIARDPPQDPRLRRFTEVVTNIVNSLMGQGLLVQSGPTDWKLHGATIINSRPPLPTDDSTKGVDVGSRWVDTTAKKIWFCVQNSVGSAIWSGPF